MPRADRYAVFWRASGQDLCTVDPLVAEQALHSNGAAVRLGTWAGTIRGRHDEWTLWWARGVPWASTGDVADGEHTLRLIEAWRAAVAQIEARGQRWDRVAPAPTPAHRPARPQRRGSLLSMLRARLGGRW